MKKLLYRIRSEHLVTKIDLKVKLSLLVFFSTFLALQANNSYSQETRISLELANVSVERMLEEIESSTEFKFVYKIRAVDLDRKVSIQVKRETIDKILNQLFKGTETGYEIIDRQVFLLESKRIEQNKPVNFLKSKLGYSRVLPMLADTLRGTITDKTGTSLVGVNVQVKGTNKGAATDFDGKFALTNVNDNAILVVSYIGYQTVEIPVNGQRDLTISLQENVETLEELVVVGYGAQKKVNLTGSVVSVGGEELSKRPTPNVQNLLQGKVSGLQITQPGGTPGGDAGSIRIRGVGTFSGTGSSPLVLVDGVEGSMQNLDPNNVESISVLKDAASAAIYGARAANGVILITTKRGRTDELSVEYHVSLEAQKATRLPDLLTNSADYMELWNEANERSGKTKYFTQEEINAFRNAAPNDPKYPNFDWVDHIFKTAFVHNHHLSVSGGNEKTNFNLAAGYLDQGGIVDPYDYNRYNLLFSLDSKVSDWITLGGNLQGSRNDITQDVQGTYNEAYFVMHAYGPGPNYTPTMTLPDGTEGYVARYSSSIAEWTVRNPDAIKAQGKNYRNNYNVRPMLYTDVKLTDDLTWYTKGAVNFDYSFRKNHENPVDNYYFKDGSYAHNGAVWNLGVRDEMNTSFFSTLFSTLQYNKEIGDSHNFSALLGYNQESYKSRYLVGDRIDFPTATLGELNAGSTNNQSTAGSSAEWAIQSFFGRLKYDFQSRYLFELNARNDGTSRIAPDTRWGFFPSVSAAWRLSEESFLKENTWLDNLKLRASWGKLGNQNVGTYPYQDVLSTTSYAFSGLEPGVILTRLVDKTLRWETTTITDIGLDGSIQNGLFYFTVDWYDKFTDDILYSIPVPASVGLSAPIVNGGQMKNTGWDIEVGHRNNIGEVNYDVNFNFSSYKNEVVNILSPTYGNNTVQEGLPFNSYYLIEWEGIFQNQADIEEGPDHPFNPQPGDLKYKDQNGDGVINADDRVVVDGYYPKFQYGGNLNVFWRNFDISLFFQGVKGVKNYIGGQHRAWGYTPFTQGSPPPMDFVNNRWTGEGSTNEYPAIYEQSYQPVNGTASTYWLLDASYVRLKNLRIGYTIPSNVIQKLGIKSTQIYFSGDNLFTVTDYPGADPERSSLTSAYSTYPNVSIYAFGIKIKL